jgi:SAM-dependent methyltransferase
LWQRYALAVTSSAGKWPKTFPPLTAEQERIRDDFMHYWHEVLPKKYGVVERFNHGWPAKTARPGERTLEIGSGLGEHINAEPEFARQGYVACELRPEMADVIRERHPEVEVITGDCQQRMPLDDASFDRVLAVHVLEHLPDLPAALREIRRVLKPQGRFVAVIPCEGGLAYGLARRISAQRIFERRYKMSYKFFIEREHINVPAEIFEECRRAGFRPAKRSYFPLRVPVTTANLAIGIEFTAA